jgi:tetratricopeptide (TPR) repeat protein
MSHKRREQKRQQRAEIAGGVRWPGVLRAVLLGGAVALLVIGAMLPSESAISEGTYAPLAAGWCLLLVVWTAAMWLDDQPTVRIGWTEAIGAALVGWHSLAAMLSLGYTNGRHALNAHWLVVGYGLTVFLFRQTVRTAEQARSLVAAMLWLATLLASLGLYQYFYGMPRQRREYERDRAKVLAEYRIPTEEGSAERKHFEDRIYSKEPIATFGLTNSLAGVLGPWLVAAIAISQANFWNVQQRRSVAALFVCAGLMASCLVLTKSRTAYLAVMAGLVLVGLYGRRAPGGWRLDWRIPSALAGAVIVIGLIAVYFGGLDAQVLSEAPKAVLYRVEYWRATARIIGTYPLFGCGPGNFQEAYAAVKLPQASETVADPHNFLLEMWATAGTPAVVLLIGLLLAFAVDVSTAVHRGKEVDEPSDERPVAPAKWIVLGGIAIGLFIAPAVATALGYSLESISDKLPLPVVWLLGFPLLAGVWWSLDAWMARGELRLAAAIIPQIVLLINLLAAGALMFPAVIATLLVLTPVALCLAAEGSRELGVGSRDSEVASRMGLLAMSRRAIGVLALAAAAAVLACLYTEYYPVLNGRLALANAVYRLETRQYRDALPEAAAAAKADGLSPEPWRLLAELQFGQWEATGDAKDWERFVETADTYCKLDPRHHVAWFTRGTWFLTAWKKSGRQEDLDEAVAAYRKAVEWYPSEALYHAQLAWTLHLAGDPSGAQKEAQRAYELDQKMPHQEKKLAHQHVVDPEPHKKPATVYRDESAEQTAGRLRTASAEE